MSFSIPRHRKFALAHRHLLCLLCLFAAIPQLSAATFTNNITITETNTTYEGQDIVISGATVTIDGPHSFNSIRLTNNAALTHSAGTALEA